MNKLEIDRQLHDPFPPPLSCHVLTPIFCAALIGQQEAKAFSKSTLVIDVSTCKDLLEIYMESPFRTGAVSFLLPRIFTCFASPSFVLVHG